MEKMLLTLGLALCVTAGFASAWVIAYYFIGETYTQSEIGIVMLVSLFSSIITQRILKS